MSGVAVEVTAPCGPTAATRHVWACNGQNNVYFFSSRPLSSLNVTPLCLKYNIMNIYCEITSFSCYH